MWSILSFLVTGLLGGVIVLFVGAITAVVIIAVRNRRATTTTPPAPTTPTTPTPSTPWYKSYRDNVLLVGIASTVFGVLAFSVLFPEMWGKFMHDEQYGQLRMGLLLLAVFAFGVMKVSVKAETISKRTAFIMVALIATSLVNWSQVKAGLDQARKEASMGSPAMASSGPLYIIDVDGKKVVQPGVRGVIEDVVAPPQTSGRWSEKVLIPNGIRYNMSVEEGDVQVKKKNKTWTLKYRVEPSQKDIVYDLGHGYFEFQAIGNKEVPVTILLR
ncbi:MAG: hypothetical protein UV88_C0014G0014 [Parcubacteria group bacterium GW2011_GWA1_43_21]|uniref:Uncharacterized protein n=1 Tax=Candidatus Vogelbacteria bacterium RIFOXYB1_FULL_42_16 TaxID=1802436 RepID=A0A1G2QC43_9BACT|nr:MAG: hypothetical protein UV50_C0017G0017 [Parcubacteria group bacterium GW2011_GWB1_42_9]KKT09216.1 MAG: hypothetical protein UV88_C0014G0014 [Parcubacteria group bacterium GW2011_GWA1_43_21]OHA58136.1 MAG: hypothetical protein A2370_02295 [Candidatus Vogelbacteria bacterium RIFOXYB1_FULL_42_16]